MTKAENRAAAKAWHEERERERRQAAYAEAVKADLAELERLRTYLIHRARSGVCAQPLLDAIDDHAERLTGDRTTLHAHNHSIG